MILRLLNLYQIVVVLILRICRFYDEFFSTVVSLASAFFLWPNEIKSKFETQFCMWLFEQKLPVHARPQPGLVIFGAASSAVYRSRVEF